MASANLVNENTGDLIPYGGIVTPYVRDSIAPLFSTSISFAKGTYCYHEGTLYECTTAHSAGAWNPSHFTEKTVGGKLSEKQDIIDNSLTTTDKTIPGAINELKSGLNNLLLTGFFVVACEAGVNKFSRSTATLVSGSLPSSPFGKCLFSIVNHGTIANGPNTIETDGSDDILISALTAQDITVTWLDITNIPTTYT